MQLFHVYLNWLWHNPLLKCVSQPEIAKKSIKHLYFSVQGHLRSLNSVAIEPVYDFLLVINSNLGFIWHSY